MGFFNKKKKEEKRREDFPALPELPKLPELTPLENESKRIHQLPSFPSNSYGKKFSQDTIKEAVAGGKGDDYGFDADEFPDEDEIRMMQEPIQSPRTKEEFSGNYEMEMMQESIQSPRTKELSEKGSTPYEYKERGIMEPVFIRIDKFEEVLKIINESKKKISDIDKNLEEVKKLREKEEKEIQAWENELRIMKGQIMKIDRDIFSKL